MPGARGTTRGRGTSRPTALVLAALLAPFACFEGPDYEGRRCSADDPCPVELICDLDLRCHQPCRAVDECPGPRALCGDDGRCHTRCDHELDCTRANEACTNGLCTPRD